MQRLTTLLAVLAIIAAGCGGGSASCADIVDDGMDFFQEIIDDMEGMAINEISDPTDDAAYLARAEDLERRTEEAGCTDEEMTELFTDRVPVLTASDNNPGGQFLIALFTQAASDGSFSFGN